MVASLLKSGGISLDLEKCRARVGRRVVDLTLTEYNLLVCLVKNAGHPLSRRELLDAAWDQFEQWILTWVDSGRNWEERAGASGPCVGWAIN